MYACVDCQSPDGTVLLYEPNADEAGHAWYVDAPDLATWLRVWLDGTGWYEESNDGADLPLWPAFRIRTTVTRAS